MTSVVFLGPTLSAERARAVNPSCEVLPPAAQGDVLRALQRGAIHIGIIDGYFDQVPAVWHKEILYALERGVSVLGASSMGALRAAELHTFGMIGVGRIFELFRDGLLEDDDEVAVTHAPADGGYQAISEALVNLRDRIESAVAEGLLASADAAHLVARLKELPYPARSYEQAVALARQVDAGSSSRLEAFLTAPHASLKDRDALALLTRLGHERPPSTAQRVERTTFFERLRLEVAHETPNGHPPGDPPTQDDRALLGLLAEEHAELLGTRPGDDEIELVAREFRAARGLLDVKALRIWLAERGLTPVAFRERMRELATVRRIARQYAPELIGRARRLRQIS